ncbi:MAG TPA: hypothetical protein VMM60_14805 [Ilumatobacter sp.]|nr:hypothetical protein [Ilumatobacter sp.]
MSSPTTAERLLPWALRACWVGVLVVGGEALDQAIDGRSDALQTVATWGGGTLWLAGVVAVAAASVITLTAVRVIVPLAIPVLVTAWITGADHGVGALSVGMAAAAAAIASSAEFGRAFAQASAYGHEQRYPLRPPPAYLFAAAVAWVIFAAGLIAGPLLLASERWVVGGVISAFAAVTAVWAWPRWHKLARRWLVVVPVGVVVHDHLVLGETLMLRRQEVAGVRLAPADTGAYDLTGPAAGHALEIATTESVTVILAASPSQPRGTVIHLSACLVAPSRPGQALRAVAERKLPVG